MDVCRDVLGDVCYCAEECPYDVVGGIFRISAGMFAAGTSGPIVDALTWAETSSCVVGRKLGSKSL